MSRDVAAPGGAGLRALARALRTGELPLPTLLADLEERLERIEPRVRSLVAEAGLAERLERAATELATQYPIPDRRPSLYGVPVGVKDVFHVRGLPTRAGSRLPAEELAGPEGPVVGALRTAGALIAGKTVSTEFAWFAPGPTRNPRDPERTPGGSSSGSAAAVAAGIVPLALGTQTIGSISRPAAYCGIVGYKPSYDRVSRQGVIPLAPSLDHVGLLAPRLDDLALAATVLVPDWRRGVAPHPRPVLAVPSAGPYLERAEPAGREGLERALERLREDGYEVIEVPALADFTAVEERHHRLLAGEAARVHAPWLEQYRERYHRRTLELVDRGAEISDHELQEARAGRAHLRAELEDALAGAGADLWLSPAAPGPAPRGIDSTGDPVMGVPWTYAGLPTLALPAGRDADGMPLGLQVAAAFADDEELVAWGGGLEAALEDPAGGGER